MSNIRISWIYLQNFKGFARLDLSFDQCQTIILGGPNGYGKTTVFDALEILFTGRIRRMEGYAPLHNNSTSMDEEEQKPLVYDTKLSDTVIVRAGILIGDKEIVLERHAEVSEMKNPVDFGPFQRVFFSDNGVANLHEIDVSDLKEIGLGDFASHYDFLYYLSQEEAVAFLKTKESERSRMIQQLFDTTRFEAPIQQLGYAINQITRLVAEYTQQKLAIDDEISRLTATVIKGNGSEGKYVALSANCALAWDLENPNFSHEDFNMWLSEGGVIDGMLYFCQNRDAFRQNNLNRRVTMLLKGDMLKQVTTYWHYRESQIIAYRHFRETKRQYEQLRLEGLERFSISLPVTLIKENVLKEDELNRLESMRTNLVSLYNTTSDLGRIKTDLIQRRNYLVQTLTVNQKKLSIEDCPLCGTKYRSSAELLEQIETYGKKLSQSMEGIYHVVIQQFEEYKQTIGKQVIVPCDAFFAGLGINEELMTFFDRINVQQVTDNAKTIEYILGTSVNFKLPVQEIVADLSKKLQGKIVAIDDSVRISWLERIFNSYLKDIDWRSLTEEQVMAKRAYLTTLWNKRMSVTMKEKTIESKRLERCIKVCNQRKLLYKTTKRSLEMQRNHYVEEIISDIKILYYIYSGRIMQDCHYGRGLLMKPDLGRKRILFVAGSYKSDVDALYNMSSGQMVSLSIAFLLALNKLYAHNPVLAIDDPVQTIDDINLWGLMETLRHDFNNHFMLLSTHEQDYSQLLTNKFEKWGIRTNLIDMGSARRKMMANNEKS